MRISLFAKSAAVVIAIVALLSVGSVLAMLPQPQGCTLTPGYWKTHSDQGPAPYDDTWAKLPNGADTDFFESGQSYYEVLWTAPARGNAYYILAHAYIAAELNMLAGASAPYEVPNFPILWGEATGLLNTFLPEDVAKLKGGEREQWIVLAEVFDQYNNGLIGPGHCNDIDVPD